MVIELPVTPPLKSSTSALVDIERMDNDETRIGWDWKGICFTVYRLPPATMYFSCADIATTSDR